MSNRTLKINGLLINNYAGFKLRVGDTVKLIHCEGNYIIHKIHSDGAHYDVSKETVTDEDL